MKGRRRRLREGRGTINIRGDKSSCIMVQHFKLETQRRWRDSQSNPGFQHNQHSVSPTLTSHVMVHLWKCLSYEQFTFLLIFLIRCHLFCSSAATEIECFMMDKNSISSPIITHEENRKIARCNKTNLTVETILN